jgi:hypothetical protein
LQVVVVVLDVRGRAKLLTSSGSRAADELPWMRPDGNYEGFLVLVLSKTTVRAHESTPSKSSVPAAGTEASAVCRPLSQTPLVCIELKP